MPESRPIQVPPTKHYVSDSSYAQPLLTYFGVYYANTPKSGITGSTSYINVSIWPKAVLEEILTKQSLLFLHERIQL
jgi:hypothetical protein